MEFSSAAAHRHHRRGDRPATAGGGDLVHVRRPSRFSGAEAGPPASTPRVCESMPKGGWHNIRGGQRPTSPAALAVAGTFVCFRVWSSVQPQNMATPYFGSFEDLGRQPTDFRPRGTRRSSCRRCCSCHPTRGMAERDPDRRPREAGQHMHILGVVSFVLPPGSCTLAIARN